MASNTAYAPVYGDADHQPFPETYQPQPHHYNPYAQQDAFDPRAPTQYQYGGLEADRGLARTPSPTPSEVEALEDKKMFNWRKTFALKKENIIKFAILGIILALIIVFSVLQNKIIKALQPAANWAHDTKGGFLIPIALFIILSFPPLFGAEFIAILCGVVWGAGVGFAITAVGQFLGELANYFVFKYMCQARSEALKKKNIKYAALGRVIEEGGLLVAVVARYSIIPTHLITALFATCGMKLWVFAVSAILSLPENFVNVYIGATFEAESKGTSTEGTKLVNIATIVITAVVTIGAMRYIDSRINAVKPDIVHERRKARQFAASSNDFDSTVRLTTYPPSSPNPDIRHAHTSSV